MQKPEGYDEWHRAYGYWIYAVALAIALLAVIGWQALIVIIVMSLLAFYHWLILRYPRRAGR